MSDKQAIHPAAVPRPQPRSPGGGGGGWKIAAAAAALALGAGVLLGQRLSSAPLLPAHTSDAHAPPHAPAHAHAPAHDAAECKHAHNHAAHTAESTVRCPVQPPPLDRGQEWIPAASARESKQAYERLAGAIKIRTETFDDMSFNATDPAFDVFYNFEKYLRDTFPLFHKSTDLEHVNTHGLLFTWRGANEALKPIDVVPVNKVTEAQWTHPPFDAVLDADGWVWGRGTTDMKSTLIALLSSAERLMGEGFAPERTVLFSLGFDEEIGGQRGAATLAQRVMERYGPDGIALVVDEGFTGVDSEYGATLARVGLAEKGCLTVRMSVAAPGGHSSRPPVHTGIGIIGMLFAAMEAAPGPIRLDEHNPFLGYLECAAQHGTMDPNLKAKVRCPECWPALAQELAARPDMELFIRSTQAITVVNGGIKFNALPEFTTSLTNYRTAVFETSREVLGRLVGAIAPIAARLNMTLDAFGTHPDVLASVIRLETVGVVLEPAPLTPSEGAAFDLVGGTIRQIWPDAVVVPSMMTAFTDTQWYWDSSPHIYRFAPASMAHMLNYHTVDERIHLDAHLSMLRFFYKLLQNAQGRA